MQLGDTFRFTNRDSHLWIVLSDPALNPTNVLIVNLTSQTPGKDSTCVLNVGDHPFIRHPTIVYYGKARSVTDALLEQCVREGAINLAIAMERAVLKRIIDGGFVTSELSVDFRSLLRRI